MDLQLDPLNLESLMDLKLTSTFNTWSVLTSSSCSTDNNCLSVLSASNLVFTGLLLMMSLGTFIYFLIDWFGERQFLILLSRFVKINNLTERFSFFGWFISLSLFIFCFVNLHSLRALDKNRLSSIIGLIIIILNE